MNRLVRVVIALGHVVWSVFAFLALCPRSRRGILVLTHVQDLDLDGRDHQMGPLVDEMVVRKIRLAEATFVPFSRGALLRNWRIKKRLFVSHGALMVVARVLAFPSHGNRLRRWKARVTKWLLLGLKPRAVLLIDESGSGQSYVRACRELGIPTYGVQHGDFQPGNLQYDSTARRSEDDRFEPVPVDVFFVWSDWFRDRLIRRCSTYDLGNTRVVGRVRFETTVPKLSVRDGKELAVLVLAEASSIAKTCIAPFLSVLREDPEIETIVRPHPSEVDREESLVSLEDQLAIVDVAVGISSSALLEAIYRKTPVVCLRSERLGDAAGYIEGGVALPCDEPTKLLECCRRAARTVDVEGIRGLVWSGGTEDPVSSILEIVGGGLGRKTP